MLAGFLTKDKDKTQADWELKFDWFKEMVMVKMKKMATMKMKKRDRVARKVNHEARRLKACEVAVEGVAIKWTLPLQVG